MPRIASDDVVTALDRGRGVPGLSARARKATASDPHIKKRRGRRVVRTSFNHPRTSPADPRFYNSEPGGLRRDRCFPATYHPHLDFFRFGLKHLIRFMAAVSAKGPATLGGGGHPGQQTQAHPCGSLMAGSRSAMELGGGFDSIEA